MTPPIEYGRVVRLSPLVRRVTQHNPGLFAGPGTNTHLVGSAELVILDPGEEKGDGHLDRIVEAVGDATVVAVIPSHGHPDHWPLARTLADRVGAPIAFFGTHPGFRTDWSLADGDVVAGAGFRLAAIHTPGHLPDHLAFVLEEERALFPGDVVMDWSTSIIAPPDGDLVEYLRSLERLLAIPDLAVAYPAHGTAIIAPYDRIRELLAHRALRTAQALEALGRGPGRIRDLVAVIYRDVDPALHPAAAHSLRAHLLALEATGRVARSVDRDPTAWEETIWALR